MLPVQQIAFYLTLIVFIFVAGVPFSLLFLKTNQEGRFIPTTFLLGIVFLVLLSFWSSILGFPFNKSAPFIVAIILFLLFIFLIFRKEKLIFFLKSIKRKDIILLGICIVAGGLTLIPVIVFNAQYAYSDEYTYICISDYLMNEGYNTMAQLNEYKPWLSQTVLYQTFGFRMGSQMLLALFTSIFGRLFSIELYAPCTAVGVLLAGCSVWQFSKQQFPNTKNVTTIAVIMTVFNAPILIWCASFGFLPQLFGMSLYLFCISNFIEMESWAQNWKAKCVLLSMLLATLIIVYTEMVPFLVLVVISLYIAKVVKRKELWCKLLLYLLACSVGTILLTAPFIVSAVKGLIIQFGVAVGWDQMTNWWGYIGYILSTVPINYIYTGSLSITSVLYSVITLLFIFCIVLGIIKCSQKENSCHPFKELIILSLPYILMFIYFTSFVTSPFTGEVGNRWSIFKLVQYYFIIAVPYIAFFIATVFESNKLIMKIGYISMFMYITFNSFHIWEYQKAITEPMREYTGNLKYPMDEYYKLYDKYRNEDKTINLVGLPEVHRKMVTYFLKDQNLVSDWSSDGTFSIYGELANPVFDYNELTLLYNPSDSESIANLAEYRDGFVYVTYGDGFYSRETDGTNYWYWASNAAELNIYKYKTGHEINLIFDIGIANPLSENNTLQIYMKDKLLLEQKLNMDGTTHVTMKIDMGQEDESILKFVFTGDSKPADQNDSRELAFGIWNLEIQ